MRWLPTCKGSAYLPRPVADAMDIGTVRGLITLALFIAFVALVFWAFSKRRKAEFDKMARMPLEEDQPAKDPGSKTP